MRKLRLTDAGQPAHTELQKFTSGGFYIFRYYYTSWSECWIGEIGKDFEIAAAKNGLLCGIRESRCFLKSYIYICIYIYNILQHM